MADSLFLSPGFILVEFSFIIVASIAAYELLVGDFIWAQQEEARRTSMQSNRGRGYDSFESRQLQLHGHRSLSPGGRGRGSRSAPGSRRGSAEDAPNFPSRSRGVNRFTEESTIPDHPRFASPGRGSSGDSTRRLFYKFILIALLSRFILFPVETYCLSQTYNSSTLSYDPSLLRIMLRISQTLPDIAFASALGLLVIFCATIAFAAMPPLTPDLSEGSMHGPDDAETIEDGISERTGLLGEGAVKGQENIEGKDATNRLKRNSKMAFSLCIAAARLPRTVLASRKTFSTWNIILSISYTLIFFTALVIPHCPLSMCEISLWILIATIYSFLLLALIYVAALLGKTLHPGIVSQKNSYSLALRLVGTCTLLAIMFIDRVACFGMVAHHAIINLDGSDHEERIRSSYRRSAIEYAISESLPVLFILFMMHRKRKEVHNDVIIHSIMNNLFGSTGFLGASESSQLDTTNTSSAPADGTGSATARGGLGGSRRFQTYGGTRGDSFPAPSSSAGNKPRRNIPRATSSSGGGRPKQQHGNATDALALENGSKKGGLKPYGPVRSLVTRDDR